MNRARGGISSEDAVVNDTSSVGSSEVRVTKLYFDFSNLICGVERREFTAQHTSGGRDHWVNISNRTKELS
jgi:hypothetical protein